MRRLLGMFNFYRCLIPQAAHILAPIVQFLEGHTNQKKSHSSVRKSSEPLKWDENAEQAFLAAYCRPPSEAHHYLLTIIDRFSRSNPNSRHASENHLPRNFQHVDLSFWLPICNHLGSRNPMRSSMYAEFTRMPGTEKIKTTTCHPKSNGIVERFQRHLKSAIKAHEDDTWSEIVPIILLGIRTAVKDLQSSCTEIVYVTNLRLPSDMIDASSIPFCDNNFITNLCNRMQQLNPVAHLLTALINSTFILHCNHHLIYFQESIVCNPLYVNRILDHIKFCPEQTKPSPLTLMVEKLQFLFRSRQTRTSSLRNCV
ncbi:transposon Ty3-I Gag-Pol polyprotein [Trichonephila clavipes]|nr:transposon Ty3-I Gag-Pol polyprotein [Trichonephila clavipes]